MGQRAFRGDEICADAFWLRNLKRDLCKRKLFKVEIIILHLQTESVNIQTQMSYLINQAVHTKKIPIRSVGRYYFEISSEYDKFCFKK